MSYHPLFRLAAPIALAVLILPLISSQAHAIEPVVLATQGGGGVAACASCHGGDGGGMASFPRLAGMDAAYLEKQLHDFVDGSRSNAVMAPIAKALSPEDRAAIAVYYAALPVPAASTGPAKPSTADGSVGARLALQGRWSASVPGCMQCHGPQGQGVGEHFPALIGQPAGYIAAQLKAFKEGTRKNDPLELMRHLSKELTDTEINAVSKWLAGLPADPAHQPASAGGPS